MAGWDFGWLLSGRLIGWWHVRWLADCVVVCSLAGWRALWPFRWLSGWLPTCLSGWLAIWLAGWLAICLADWLAGWLANWLAGELAG